MRYDITLQGNLAPQEYLDLARYVEAAGFERLWITDSSLHAGDFYVYAALVLSGTERLVVGSAVTNPVTRNIGITANAFSSLNELAPGRVICGIAIGEAPLHELGLRRTNLKTLEQSIDVLRRLWRGEEVSAEVGQLSLESAKLTRPTSEIPVYVAATGPKTLAMSGRVADGILALPGLFPESVTQAQRQIETGEKERTLEYRPETVLIMYGALNDDHEIAMRDARPIASWITKVTPSIARMAGMDDELIQEIHARYSGGEFQLAQEAAALIPEDIVRKMALVGDSESAAGTLAWLSEIGVERVSLSPIGSDRRRTIDLFVEATRAV